jgi:PPM family protein phosphatase
MTSKSIQCPACGHTSQDLQWCDNCGAPLEQAEARPAEGAAPSESAWLEPGQRYSLRTIAGALGVEGVPADRELLVELEIDRLLEQTHSRHSLLAHAVSARDQEGWALPDERFAQLAARRFVVEEVDGQFQAPRHPQKLRASLRLPLSIAPRHSHTVYTFLHDNTRALVEIVERLGGALDVRQIRSIFSAVLDRVEAVHEAGYLSLRLTPWHLLVSAADGADLLSLFLPAGVSPGLEEVTSTEGSRGEAPKDEAAQTLTEEHDEGELFPSPHEETDEFSLEQIDPPAERALAETEELAALQAADKTHEEDEDPDGPSFLDALESMAASISIDPLSRTLPGSPPDYMTITPPGIECVALLDGNFTLYPVGHDAEAVPGVIGFSAPEMFGRSRAELTPVCDLFSLGMVLYYLLAGELPPTSIYTRHTPAIPARHFRPTFPIGLAGVISRATRPDPRERFPSVAAMRAAFENACDVIERRLRAEARSERPVLDLAADRHVGINKGKRNPVNQDHVFAASSEDGRFALIVVADGVSTASYGSGDLASKCLADAAIAAWEDILPLYLMDDAIHEQGLIQRILEDANRKIVQHINEHHLPFRGNPHEVMGTTALVSIYHRGVFTLGSLGDSRVYLQRGPMLEQITIDHNLWTLSILDGVPADTAMALPHGDALARCLGTFYIEQQRLVAIPPQPDYFQFPVIPGDNVIFTTDGIIDYAGATALASEDQILSVMLAEPNPALACLELILTANRGGGGDNLGIAIARMI